MYLEINKIGILWLLITFFGVLQSEPDEFYWIPYEMKSVQTKLQTQKPGYIILQGNNEKLLQSSSIASGNYENNHRYKIAPNSEHLSQKARNNNYNNYRPREAGSASYYNYYVNDKSYKTHKGWEKEKNAPQLHFRELDDLKVQPRKTVNNSLSKRLSASEHIEARSSLNDKTASKSSSQEEIRRATRQTRKQRPGFLWTLFRVAFESVNETRSAISQISDIIGNGIQPDPTTRKPGSGMILLTTTEKVVTTDSTGNSSTTTTEAPFVLTRSFLQNIIRRNWKGLVRLFNIEWQDALNQSKVTTKEFQRELGNQIGTYLKDNPDAY